MTRVNTAISIVLLGLSLVSTNGAHAAGTTTTGAHTFTIHRTNDGFEPAYLKISQGDTVTFVNDSNADIWPASNFHPTHTLYPEFDPLKGYAPGKSWSFTFQKTGLWRMHDHLSPHTTGAIEVVPTSGSTNSTSTPASNHPGFFARVRDYVANLWQRLFAAPAKKASISGQMTDPKLVAEFKSQNEQAKYKWLEDIAQQYNPETAWAYVKAAYDTPAGVVGNAHDMAHLVGQLIFKQYGFDGLSICDPTFAFGCFHGFMEVAFDKEHPEQYESNLQKGQDSCKALGDMKSPSYWSCIHGMGHGIASYRDYDLDSSLTDCDRLDPQVRTYCHDGVFMEFLNKSSPHFYKTSDPIYPCDTVGEEYKIACARSQATVMRVRLGMTTPQIADACLATHNDKIMFNCIDSIGYFIGQTNAANASQVVTDCREIREDAGAAQCMAAAAGELVFQDSVGWREGAQQICSSLRGTYKDLCFARVDQVKQSYGRK